MNSRSGLVPTKADEPPALLLPTHQRRGFTPNMSANFRHRGSVLQCLHNILDHFLGIGEEHHRLIHVEHIIVDPGITDPAH